MKPLIGISPSTEIEQTSYMTSTANAEVILKTGGIPVLLALLDKKEDIKQVCRQLDGLYLTGGFDIDPILFNEEPLPNLGTIIPARDKFELAMICEMRSLHKPILGVCRGAQMMNIALGGDMYQDIYSQIEHSLLQHSQNAPKEHGSHIVSVEKESLLNRLTGKLQLKVNSRHHQANRYVPYSMQISGKASDGIIEAVEAKQGSFYLGVQWHPENMAMNDDESSKKIYTGFIKECKKQKKEPEDEYH